MVFGRLTLCPGTAFSLTCSYGPSSNEATRWEFSPPNPCTLPITHRPPTADSCGPFTINMVSDASVSSMRYSTAHAVATKALDGTVVVCKDGSDFSDSEVGRVTIRVIGN